MAKADYIRCDHCDTKLVYDGYDAICDAIDRLGLGNMPVYCETCRQSEGLAYAYTRNAGEWKEVTLTKSSVADAND